MQRRAASRSSRRNWRLMSSFWIRSYCASSDFSARRARAMRALKGSFALWQQQASATSMG